MRQISESDWKLFSQLRPLALERFCQGVLAEVTRLAAEGGPGSHERYLAVFKLLQRQDKELGEIFNNPRRSAALLQLARLRVEGLLTEEEFARFGAETRAAVQLVLGG
jgi:hypothetical protein